VWLKFKGGKGVATYIGVLLGLFWPAALAFCAIWIAVALIFRYSPCALVASVVPVMLLVAAHRARRRFRAHDRRTLDHAPRQHSAADERHRRQDRQKG
jgi:glycerol-3-phosphate acyltransferase PlsY